MSHSARSVLAAVFAVLLFPRACYSGSVTGTLEGGIQADNRMGSDLSLNHLGYLSYQSDSQALQATVDYLVRTASDSELNQLYGQYQLPQQLGVATAGRFNRFDNLGYYTLDGIQLVQQQDGHQLQFYGGRPRRTDDDHTLTGNYLYGIEALFAQPLSPSLPSQSTDDDTDSWFSSPPAVGYRLGFQQLKQGSTASRLNLGLSYKNNFQILNTRRQELNITGSYQFDQQTIEDLLFDSRLYADRRNYLQFTYEYYEPDRNNPTFRERFYSSYVLGEQQLAEAALHHLGSNGTQWTVAGRKTTRENSSANGYGFRASLAIQPAPYAELIAEIDRLTLGDDKIESLWLLGSHSPDAKTRFSLETGLQFENKSLYGFNRAVGFRASYQYMINRDFFLTVSAEQLWNSRKADDYLTKCYLVYYLYRD